MVMRPRRRMRAASTPQEPEQRGGGEQVDAAAEQSIRLAHRALSRFPELVGRHRYVAGGAAVAGALVVLASVAIARRMLRGQTAEEAVEGVTQAEIESLHPRERDDDPTSSGPAPSEPAPPATREPAPLHSNGATANGYAATGNRVDSQN